MENRDAPSYLDLTTDSWRQRVSALRDMASPCLLCPRRCGVRRADGETGYCRTGPAPMVSSVQPHFGEESCLVGRGGSGTIFFTNCNLGCLFCQNADISHGGHGHAVTVDGLAHAMLSLQELGCHNINLVTPSHQVHGIVEALGLAASRGLRLPVVYNTGGYDAVDTLRLLDGIMDIYMPDLKFMDPETSARLADAPDYPETATDAIRAMHAQVGDLAIGPDGVARRGLLVRHLVLPEDLSTSGEAFRFLAREISPDTYLNIMAQYRPCHRAVGLPGMGRRPSTDELEAAVALARAAGLRRLDGAGKGL